MSKKNSDGDRRKRIANLAWPDPASLEGARRGKPSKALHPMLATLVDQPADGIGWLHEIKFDGYRLLANAGESGVRMLTRNGHDWTGSFPGIASAIEPMPAGTVLDGEAVVLDRSGVSDFQALQNVIKGEGGDAVLYYVFDLPFFAGYDLTRVPLLRRKEVLEEALHILGARTIRYSEHVRGQGPDFLEVACERHLEGVVSKRTESRYLSKRSRDWQKSKCSRRQELVIGGFTRPQGSREGFGALIMGYFPDGSQGDALVYAGKVGTGFSDETLRTLHEEMSKLERKTPPFLEPPPVPGRDGPTWVRPELVAEVEFTTWTDEGRLRHPAFKGLRRDKPAGEVVRETRAKRSGNDDNAGESLMRDKKTEVAGVRISHPDRTLYEEAGVSKLDLAEYYDSVAEWILPHVADRPLVVVRCPAGVDGECFYQKHMTDALPSHLKAISIREKEGSAEYFHLTDRAGLIALVQLGVLELHPWGSRVDKVERPDILTFDLDPGKGVEWGAVIAAARDVRDMLEDLGLTAFVKTSGGKGLHVVAPVERRRGWEEHKEFASMVATLLARRHPDRYTDTMSKSKREGRIFVDYLRNGRGATAVAAYSTRARKGAPVSTPLRWDELTPELTAAAYTIENLSHRLGALAEDPWKGYFGLRQSVTKKMMDRLASRLKS